MHCYHVIPQHLLHLEFRQRLCVFGKIIQSFFCKNNKTKEISNPITAKVKKTLKLKNIYILFPTNQSFRVQGNQIKYF